MQVEANLGDWYNVQTILLLLSIVYKLIKLHCRAKISSRVARHPADKHYIDHSRHDTYTIENDLIYKMHSRVS
jgi:hypothetical protein